MRRSTMASRPTTLAMATTSDNRNTPVKASSCTLWSEHGACRDDLDAELVA